jgi:hypothetical protein
MLTIITFNVVVVNIWLEELDGKGENQEGTSQV